MWPFLGLGSRLFCCCLGAFLAKTHTTHTHFEAKQVQKGAPLFHKTPVVDSAGVLHWPGPGCGSNRVLDARFSPAGVFGGCTLRFRFHSGVTYENSSFGIAGLPRNQNYYSLPPHGEAL